MRAVLAQAERHLAAVDPVMAQVIQAHGPCTLAARRRDPFHVLCASIVSQQLSSKAADTILARVQQALGANPHLLPAHLLATTPERLRACGLSNAKAKWLMTLAQRTESGEFSFRRLARLGDEAAIEALDALPGIGRWTAEMYLIFALRRLDIFAMDDVGLRRSMDRLYGRGRRLSDRRTLAITRPWAPYRSVASWYLWRWADGDLQAWA